MRVQAKGVMTFPSTPREPVSDTPSEEVASLPASPDLTSFAARSGGTLAPGYPDSAEYQYLAITRQQTSTVTPRWLVESKHGSRLGVVKLFPRWRCFTFHPDEDTTFNSGCLADIAHFCDQVTGAWRREVRARG